MLAIRPQNSSGPLGHHLRAGRDALDHQRADHQRHGRVRRDAEREHRDERGLRAGIVGGFRRRHAADVALAEAARRPARPSSRPCRRRTTRAARRRPAGCRGSSRARCRARSTRSRCASPRAVGSTLPMREVNTSCLSLCSRLKTTSVMPKKAMASATKPSPSASSGQPKAKRMTPELTSVPTRPEQDAEAHHGDRLEQRAARQHHRGDQPEHHQREIIGRAELERELGERRGEIGDHQRRDAAGDERADRGDAERRPGAAAARHLVAVERGDDGGRSRPEY